MGAMAMVGMLPSCMGCAPALFKIGIGKKVALSEAFSQSTQQTPARNDKKCGKHLNVTRKGIFLSLVRSFKNSSLLTNCQGVNRRDVFLIFGLKQSAMTCAVVVIKAGR